MEALLNEYNQLLLQEHKVKEMKNKFIKQSFDELWNKRTIGNKIIEKSNICLEYNQIAIYISNLTDGPADIIFTSVNFEDESKFELIYGNGRNIYYYVKKDLETSMIEKKNLIEIGYTLNSIILKLESERVIFNLTNYF